MWKSAHIRQSMPDYGHSFQVKVLNTFLFVRRSEAPCCCSDCIAFFNHFDLYWTSPESGDLQCKPWVSKTLIGSRSKGSDDLRYESRQSGNLWYESRQLKSRFAPTRSITGWNASSKYGTYKTVWPWMFRYSR